MEEKGNTHGGTYERAIHTEGTYTRRGHILGGDIH